MALKRYKAKDTGIHALTGIYLIRGQEYEIEESLAGSELFDEIKKSADVPDVAAAKDKKLKEGK
jgi:hypothetical protein